MLENGFKRRSYQFALALIKFVDALPNEPSCWVISKQLLRSGTSVGANIVEAQSASSRRDFLNFYTYALKSGRETAFWLSLLRDSNKLTIETWKVEGQRLFKEMDETIRMLAKSVLTLKSKIQKL